MNVWLVIWKDGGRIGSVPLTLANLKHFNERFCMNLIQRDASGTEHWSVLGVKKQPR